MNTDVKYAVGKGIGCEEEGISGRERERESWSRYDEMYYIHV